jgi:hypothetical protein
MFLERKIATQAAQHVNAARQKGRQQRLIDTDSKGGGKEGEEETMLVRT